jgi:hypothetical protein
MVDLRYRRPEAAAQLRLDRRQLFALALEAAGLREVKVDHEHGHKAALRHRRLG